MNPFVLKTISDLIPQGARVLDLGCGSGELLAYLQTKKNCKGYGIELNDQSICACIKRGVQVIQLNLDEGLDLFEDNSFDVVLQIDTLQHLRDAQVMLRETVRVGKTGIIAFPNFAHWPNRLRVLTGRMPVTKRLPYQWYDTPNIRVGTYEDFSILAAKNHLTIQESFGIQDDAVIRWGANWRAGTAVFKLTR